MSDIRIRLKQRIPKPEVRPSRRSALLLWLISAVGIWVSSFSGIWLSPVLSHLNPQLQLLISNLLYYLPFVALPVFLLAKRTPELYKAYRPYPISPFNTLCVIVLALMGVFFVNDIAVLWSIPFQKLGFDVFTTNLPAAYTTGELMLSIVAVAVLPGICEEFLFRGVIMSAFEQEGTRRAMRVSSVLFMLLHASLIGAPTQLILGMVLACLVFWTDSIYAGLIYHTVHNTAALILEFIQNRSPVPEETIVTQDLLEAIGGLSGAAMLAFEVLLTGALMFITLKMFRLRGHLQGVTIEIDDKKPLRHSEWAILITGIVLCAILYGNDVITMLGG